MATTSVRIDRQTHDTLRELSESEHKPIGQLVAEAVEKYQKDRFWEEAHAAYSRLRSDPHAWSEYKAETALWDTTSNDGLENEPPYYTEGELSDEEIDHSEIRGSLERHS